MPKSSVSKGSNLNSNSKSRTITKSHWLPMHLQIPAKQAPQVRGQSTFLNDWCLWLIWRLFHAPRRLLRSLAALSNLHLPASGAHSSQQCAGGRASGLGQGVKGCFAKVIARGRGIIGWLAGAHRSQDSWKGNRAAIRFFFSDSSPQCTATQATTHTILAPWVVLNHLRTSKLASNAVFGLWKEKFEVCKYL